MDTPLAAAIHKENVHIIGGEKATDKLKTAGKKRKASADLISTHVTVAGASKDVDLKQKSVMKGNKIKKNQMTRGKRHATAADRTTKKPNHILTDEEIKKMRKLFKYPIVFCDDDDESELFMMRKESLLREKYYAAAADRTTKKPNHILTDEEIEDYYEWPNHIVTDEEIRDYYEWSDHILTDEEIKKIRKSIEDADSEFCMTRLESLWRASLSKLKPLSLNDEEGYKADGSDFDCFKVVPGPYYTPEEQYDSLDKAGMVMDEFAFPKLKLDDDEEEFSVINDGGIDG